MRAPRLFVILFSTTDAVAAPAADRHAAHRAHENRAFKIFPPAMVAILKAKIAEEQAEAALEQKTVPPEKNSPDGRK